MQADAALERLGRQHAEIAARLDTFSERAYRAARPAAIVECLRDLLEAIGMHFGYEESLMEAGRYPQFDHHRRQHLGIMVELGLLLDRLTDPADGDASRSADFLVQWYRQHAEHSDDPLHAWLAARA